MSLPSLRDGVSQAQLQAFKRTAVNTIIDAGTKLNMDHAAVTTAIVFLHKFYAANSIVRNDPFLLSMACLYLGGKVEDSPKSVRDVLAASCELRYRDAARAALHDRELQDRLREQVFRAERALLYALAFEFNAGSPFRPCIRMLTCEPLRGHLARVAQRDAARAGQLSQMPFNFVNDSLRTDACLYFSGAQIAATCIWLAMKLLKEDSHVCDEHGRVWWLAYGVQEAHLEGVEQHLQSLYCRSFESVYGDKGLVLRSAGLLTPQQHQAHAAAEAARRKAASAAAPPPQQPAAAGLAPVAPPVGQQPGAAAAAGPAPVAPPVGQQPGGAVAGGQQAAQQPKQPAAVGGKGSAGSPDYDEELFAALG